MGNQVIEVIKSRRSIRKYIQKEVKEEIIKDIIDCARLAPTGYNNQGWVFLLIRDSEMRKSIASQAKYGKFLAEAPVCIAVFYDVEGATTPLQDVSAATENIIIAARAYGLGTCWVNSYKKEHTKQIMKELNCPRNLELMALISLGYYDSKSINDISKKPLEEVLKWDKF